MTSLLLGKNGQVGWELQRALAPLGPLIALDRKGNNGLSADFADLEGLRQTVRTIKPDLIVNAAAYTAVDEAEEDRELASQVNAKAPAVLAEEAEALGSLLVHYSTDYVFDGNGTRPWQEGDPVAPLNHYGATKLAGERSIQASGAQHLIFRTSWVYAASGRNFLTKMTELIQERDSLAVIDDQVGAPTGAELIADVTTHAIRQIKLYPELQGLYHLVANGETSWHGYAVTISEWLQAQGLDVLAPPSRIKSVPSQAWPTTARRPLNSRLAITKLEQAFGLQLPPWQLGVRRALAERQNLIKKQD